MSQHHRAAALAAVAVLAGSIAGAAGASSSPAADQAKWVVGRLVDGGVTRSEVQRRFSPEYLRLREPADAVAAALNRAHAEHAPFRFLRWVRPPTATQALALVSARGQEVAVRVKTRGGRIEALDLGAPPPAVARGGRYTGAHDIGGRKLLLRCVGTGTPTVVLLTPLIEDAYAQQQAYSRVTRVCAHDRANALWGGSDAAATPRTGAAVASDLQALLRAAGVPAPYVLVGHSNNGLFAQLFAARYPQLTAGLVLVDAVAAGYYDRSMPLLRAYLPRAQYLRLRADMARIPPAVLDAERLDIRASQRELGVQLRRRALRPMPLFVLSHGKGPAPNPHPRGQKLDDAREELWRQLQRELAQLVPGGRHVVARRSGHDIPREQPELVADAVRAVVAGVRRPGSW